MFLLLHQLLHLFHADLYCFSVPVVQLAHKMLIASSESPFVLKKSLTQSRRQAEVSGEEDGISDCEVESVNPPIEEVVWVVEQVDLTTLDTMPESAKLVLLVGQMLGLVESCTTLLVGH